MLSMQTSGTSPLPILLHHAAMYETGAMQVLQSKIIVQVSTKAGFCSSFDKIEGGHKSLAETD